MFRKIISATLLLACAGCNTVKVDCLGKIDASDKTICMAPGNRGALGDIKAALRKDGWKIFALSKRTKESHGSETKSDDGIVLTKEESRIIEKSRYRLYFDCSHIGTDNTSWPELSIIDNRTGEEVILISEVGWLGNEELAEVLIDAIHGKPTP